MTQFSLQQSLRRNHTDLTDSQVKQLVSVAGDHTATEAEWVQACLLLGTRQPDLPKKRRNRRLALIMVSAALVSAAGLCYRVSQIADKEVEHFVSSSNVELPTGGMSLPPEVLPAPAKTKPVIAGEEIFTGYMANLQTRIKHFWRPSHSNVSNCTTVLFKLSPDGEMSDLRVKDSSGVDTADAAALKAVEEAAPFDHLPAGAEEIVDIQFTFNYNVSKPWLPGK